jgi:hypothetical protein
LPFHAAEQHKLKQDKVSAERSDFPKLLFQLSSAGQSGFAGPSERLHFFWFVFFMQVKKMNS